jgi:nitrate reductase cytochrome c-type subunit
VIPHSIDDFTPITRSENLCVDCHGVAEKVEGEATPMPPSHYVDLRNTPGKQGEAPAGARWLCVSCHLKQTAAESLVENSAHPSGQPNSSSQP